MDDEDDDGGPPNGDRNPGDLVGLDLANFIEYRLQNLGRIRTELCSKIYAVQCATQELRIAKIYLKGPQKQVIQYMPAPNFPPYNKPVEVSKIDQGYSVSIGRPPVPNSHVLKIIPGITNPGQIVQLKVFRTCRGIMKPVLAVNGEQAVVGLDDILFIISKIQIQVNNEAFKKIDTIKTDCETVIDKVKYVSDVLGELRVLTNNFDIADPNDFRTHFQELFNGIDEQLNGYQSLIKTTWNKFEEVMAKTPIAVNSDINTGIKLL